MITIAELEKLVRDFYTTPESENPIFYLRVPATLRISMPTSAAPGLLFLQTKMGPPEAIGQITIMDEVRALPLSKQGPFDHTLEEYLCGMRWYWDPPMIGWDEDPLDMGTIGDNCSSQWGP